jgi:hypothetical protein
VGHASGSDTALMLSRQLRAGRQGSVPQPDLGVDSDDFEPAQELVSGSKSTLPGVLQTWRQAAMANNLETAKLRATKPPVLAVSAFYLHMAG